MSLDPVLLALANCPVLEQEKEGGHITFNPYPVISASTDLILAHEICHRLSGQTSYNKFATACFVRDNPAFNIVLNMLLDWYDELNQSKYSMYLHNRIQKLKTTVEIPKDTPDRVKELILLYTSGIKPDDFPLSVNSIEGLIVYADKFLETLSLPETKLLVQLYSPDFLLGEGEDGDVVAVKKRERKAKKYTLNGAGNDLSDETARSNFYFKTVAKYDNIIKTVSDLWRRNKYIWKSSYFGEINWKDLPRLYFGDALGLDVYRLFKKLSIARNIYLVVDRSGSTGSIKEPIMETAVIIADSFRRNNVPVSVLDVGHTDQIINKIDEPLDLQWFTPLASGGTPLGEVISLIDDSHQDDYLLVITDGHPYNWEALLAGLNKFKGHNLTFVIGDSFRYYYEQIGGNAIPVDPTTIVQGLINNYDITN